MLSWEKYNWVWKWETGSRPVAFGQNLAHWFLNTSLLPLAITEHKQNASESDPACLLGSGCSHKGLRRVYSQNQWWRCSTIFSAQQIAWTCPSEQQQWWLPGCTENSFQPASSQVFGKHRIKKRTTQKHSLAKERNEQINIQNKKERKDPLNIKTQGNKMMADMHPATVHFFLYLSIWTWIWWEWLSLNSSPCFY